MTDERAPGESVRVRGWVEGADDLKLWRRPATWDGVLEHAEKVLALADREAGWHTRWVLFSGGNDSLVLLHALHFQLGWPLDGVLHVCTGTGVVDEDDETKFVTTEFARKTVEGWGLPFTEVHPPLSYEQVFIEQKIVDGLPGRGKKMHRIAYARLKERAIAAHVQETKRGYWDRVVLATGIRGDESDARMGYAGKLVNRERSQVWCNPIYYATSAMMAAYRAEHDIPKNPVAEHLHMSGECLCGTYGSPEELDEISFFYPKTGERIRRWEREAKAAGCTYWTWGMSQDEQAVIERGIAAGFITEDDLWPGMDLCQSCTTRQNVLRDAGGEMSLFDQEPVGRWWVRDA